MYKFSKFGRFLVKDRTYDLVRAYRFDPHLRLIGCANDSQIASFARAWGPLSFRSDEFESGLCSAPLSGYWTFQKWLKGLVNLLSAYKESTGEREALLEFIDAQTDVSREGEPFSIRGLKTHLGIQGDVCEWLRNSTLPDLRSAVECMVFVTPIGAMPHLECMRRSSKPIVEGRWSVHTLQEALRWMAWYDEFTQHQLVCCQACRKIFRPETTQHQVS